MVHQQPKAVNNHPTSCIVHAHVLAGNYHYRQYFIQLWTHFHRQAFHGQVDTNITESFNDVLRHRYLPLQHDTTILFTLVQGLLETEFPEQEVR